MSFSAISGEHFSPVAGTPSLAPPREIPALSQWTLLLFALLLAVTAVRFSSGWTRSA